MSTLELIFAAAAADSQAADATFNELMNGRVSAIIQAKREELAKTLFNDAEEEQGE